LPEIFCKLAPHNMFWRLLHLCTHFTDSSVHCMFFEEIRPALNPPLHQQPRKELNPFRGIRLPALMDLYIHPLYVLVSKILSSILNSLALIHHLSTLSTVGPTCHFI
jgi:hypothetical protein